MKWTAGLVGALTLSLLGGCADFNWEEAEDVANSNTHLNLAAYKALYDDWGTARRRATDATLNWSELADGWAYDGGISSDGPYWTGAMDFDGDLTGDASSAEWNLAVTYTDCSYEEGLTLSGDMSWHWAVEVSSTGFSMEYAVKGNLTAVGDIEGTGEVDYHAMINVDGNSVSLDISGDVGGTPVDFMLTVNLAWL